MTTTQQDQDLTYDEYVEIYEELRGRDDQGEYAVSLRDFIETVGSSYSVPQWSKFHRRILKHLPYKMRQELRRAVGLPDPPLDAVTIARMIQDGTLPYTLTDTPEGPVVVLNGRQPARKRKPRRTASFDVAVGNELNAARQAAGLSWNELAQLALRELRKG